MDVREERGKLLSLDKRIKHVQGAMWFVPSATDGGKGYLVNLLSATCSCGDYELRRCKCKHQWAVEIRRAADAGAPAVEGVKVPRKSYPQDWPAYNAAQTHEREHVEHLLRALCEGITQPVQTGRGQRRHQIADLVFGAVMKVWGTMSARRSASDLRACEGRGSVEKAPHYNSVLRCLENPAMTALLRTLVEESAAPLAAVETRFAVDSTGFGTCVYRRWFDHKYGREMKEQTWVKAHAMVGVLTNVITSVNVTDSSGADSPELPGLLIRTDRHFTPKEVSADKAYLGHANLKAIEAVGAVPYIPFKSNSKSTGSAAWRRMWASFMLKQADFLTAYHQRSNVEATFSAVKRKFGGHVRSKLPVAQINEVLAKCLCHNLSCVVHAVYELGIEMPKFGAAPAPEVAA